MMSWMMPIFMVFITQNLPSGVGVYWVISNIFSIGASYAVYGRRLTLRSLLPFSEPTPNKPRPKLQPEARGEDEGEAEAAPEAQEARSRHGKRRGKRKKRR
jgi:membrane protein insertase Oxa1/YidC/SpoIIIJ